MTDTNRPASSSLDQRRSEDELEQARVSLEAAQEEIAALVRERDALAEQLRMAEAVLAEERTRGRLREAAVEEMRLGFESALAQLSTGQNREGVVQEELRVTLEELQATAAELEESNAALARLNRSLEDEVARRTADLEEALVTLRQEEERLRLIFEGAKDVAIITFDREGRVSAWNPGAERVLGFREEEVLGRRLDEMWTPEDLAAREPELEMGRALEEGRSEDRRWHLRKDGTRFWGNGVMMPLRASRESEYRGFLKILRDQTKARREEEQRETLLRELDHRVKNTLAVVQAVAMQSRRYSSSPADYQEGLVARLAALARSHDLLTRGTWESVSLRDIVSHTLAPYVSTGYPGRVAVKGSPVRLTPTAAITINLAFHELATNAAKYGALSVPEGRVEAQWQIERAGREQPVIRLRWRERGGPTVQPPTSRGFGTRLIERGLSREFNAEVRLDFAPEGVMCEICLPFAARIVAL